MSESVKHLRTLDLGLVSYHFGQEVLIGIHKSVVDESGLAALIFQEFNPVVTCGKNMPPSAVKDIGDKFREVGISGQIVSCDRGGMATAHMPGQLVVYSVLPIGVLGFGVRDYVYMLEQSVINLLAKYGLEAVRDSRYPGVWLGRSKICALGVRIKQRVSMYGLAINIDPNLLLFDHITPCGIHGRGVCRISDFMSPAPSMEQVKLDLTREFCEIMGLSHIG